MLVKRRHSRPIDDVASEALEDCLAEWRRGGMSVGIDDVRAPAEPPYT